MSLTTCLGFRHTHTHRRAPAHPTRTHLHTHTHTCCAYLCVQNTVHTWYIYIYHNICNVNVCVRTRARQACTLYSVRCTVCSTVRGVQCICTVYRVQCLSKLFSPTLINKWEREKTISNWFIIISEIKIIRLWKLLQILQGVMLKNIFTGKTRDGKLLWFVFLCLLIASFQTIQYKFLTKAFHHWPIAICLTELNNFPDTILISFVILCQNGRFSVYFYCDLSG